MISAGRFLLLSRHRFSQHAQRQCVRDLQIGIGRVERVQKHVPAVAPELLEIGASGKATVHVLGNDIAAGQLPQLVIPGGSWQGSRLLPGGEYALFSTTMSPAFVPEDYENADGVVMIEKYPEHAALIRALTGELKYL